MLAFAVVGIAFEDSAIASRDAHQMRLVDPWQPVMHEPRKPAPRPHPQRRPFVDLPRDVGPVLLGLNQLLPRRGAAPRLEDFLNPLLPRSDQFSESRRHA